MYFTKKNKTLNFDEKISLQRWKKILQFPYIISIGKCAKSLIESSNFDTRIVRVKVLVKLAPYLAASPPLAEQPVQVTLLCVPETSVIHLYFNF